MNDKNWEVEPPKYSVYFMLLSFLRGLSEVEYPDNVLEEIEYLIQVFNYGRKAMEKNWEFKYWKDKGYSLFYILHQIAEIMDEMEYPASVMNDLEYVLGELTPDTYCKEHQWKQKKGKVE